MNILSIETSCDETAISILEASGGFERPSFSIRANITHTQIDIHKEYGGVFPALAKREHALQLPLILREVFKQAEIAEGESCTISKEQQEELRALLAKDSSMYDPLITTLESLPIPNIDYIAVTIGPGLEPALWVGITFAKALSLVWDKPLVPVNHMEGHVLSVLIDSKKGVSGETLSMAEFQFPILALLISGGHTELVLMEDWLTYRTIGATVDDAVGEAFDKVARILGLPYPGGPEISKLAEKGEYREDIVLPRPMIHSGDYNFSFSGIKTACLYLSQKIDITDENIKNSFAKEFQTAVTDVLLKKTLRALEEYNCQTLIIAGGVSANTYIKERFAQSLPADITLLLPTHELATDNSLMIGIAGYFQALQGNTKNAENIRALGNWKLGE